jgi:hypothetical protein
MQLEWDNTTLGCPGSDASGNAVPSHPNYDTPALTLTPSTGYPTAPFKIQGLFYAAGDRVASTFTDAGTVTSLGAATANASGQTTLLTKVPARAKPGAATVTGNGSSGKASAAFTVLGP